MTWILSHLFADQKFMSIFHIIWCGYYLNYRKKNYLQARLSNYIIQKPYTVLIGLLHAHLIWYGDILVAYALCSFLVYPFRKLSPENSDYRPPDLIGT